MAKAAGRNRCVICEKDRATLQCGGCLQEYCFNHLIDHRQELSQKLDEVEVSHDLVRQRMLGQITDLQKHPLIEEITKWEHESIQRVQQIAEETRQILFNYSNGHLRKIEVDLNKFSIELKQSRDENDFYETDLHHSHEELGKLSTRLTDLLNTKLRRDNDSSFIKKISIDIAPISQFIPKISANAKWIQNGISVAGGNGQGKELNQLYKPHGLCIDDDQTMYVADYKNHRIIKWTNSGISGQVVAGGQGQGNRNDQLNHPTDVLYDKKNDSLIISEWGNRRVVRWPCQNGAKAEILISNICCWGLAMDSDGYLCVSDLDKHEVRRWKIGEMRGEVVAGGNGAGKHLNQLDGPSQIFIDRHHSVYVSDENNHRVMKWVKGASAGIVVANGQSPGSNSTQVFEPRGLCIDKSDNVYVADWCNHRVMRWMKGATEGSIVVGGNGQGQQGNQFFNPWGLSFDRQGNLYVTDRGNHRIQKFNIVQS